MRDKKSKTIDSTAFAEMAYLKLRDLRAKY